jgi:hypothetical protein|tara:strand:- start:3032 stop:3439 length:408 start_codon:yes stop_codon:yes gene_type:complete
MSDEKAPFNMAIATLERLSDILREINKVEQSLLPLNKKQEHKVYLVRQFYIQSVPLLTENQREKTKDILDLLPIKKQIILNSAGSRSKEGGMEIIYDLELEKKLNEALIKVQVCLQDEKYFMPPRRDRGKAISEF